MNYEALADDGVEWDKLDKDIFGTSAETPKYEPKDHQKEAIDNAHEYYQSYDRGKLIMACGTGKTFTSLKISENETKDINNTTILFLAPSISLVGQTLREWCSQATNPIHGICVCSDPKISKKVEDSDENIESVIDLALPASTDPHEIGKQIKRARELQKKDGGMVVVFSTYQSISSINAVQSLKNDFIFDICVCDEAHRTTGVTLKDEDESEFVKVHDPLFIKAKKRLYMTATPRLYSDSSKKKAQDKDAILCSMDDEAIYGKEIYRIGFGEAVKRGLLSDYKVLILTLNEDELAPALQNAISNADSEISVDDSVKYVGCINALSKITKDSELLNEVDPGLMHNAIAFCQSIKVSKKTKDALEKCKEAYYSTLTPEEREKLVDIEVDHIDGSMGATERAEKLNWLKKVDRDSNSRQYHILTNVKCLSEGVDVPSLDAVLFLSARNSQVDVVQSVGRVMRRANNKKYGYIIIPVIIPAGVKPEEALDDNKRFAVVWTVLQALRAHDDRFNATVNKIELSKKKPTNILIGGSLAPDGDEIDGNDELDSKIYKQLELNFEEFQSVVFAKMVEKCGDRRYWEQWAADVAKIAERHIYQIKDLIKEDGSSAQKAFNRYMKGLRKNINPYVNEEDAIEMLAQHFITQPVFEALFENYSFVQNNPISKAMESMVRILHEQTPKEDNEKLERFYESVRERAKGIKNAEEKQKVIVELYDKFFKTAFPRTVEKLGIVYTPVEVVDFIINSVEDVLKKEFNRSMTDEGVHILDPFTGTGTFMVRLLQSGIIKPEDIGRKYKNELHACEIVLLAYYIASINIENAYHDIVHDNAIEQDFMIKNKALLKYDLAAENIPQYSGMDNKQEYEEFNGIVLTDTFQMTEDNSALIEDVFPQNSARVNKLKNTPITVIIGNPPYSIGQKSANDDAQNQHYLKLDTHIDREYVQNSKAALNKATYDSYVKAFRWSADRLSVFDKNEVERINNKDGVIGFVTNAAWLDSNGLDGMRKCFEKEFSSIYIFNLRGNQRTSGELSRKEGGKIFGSGSRTPIAITLLVKKKDHKGKAKIHYLAVDDYLTREDKLNLCKEYKSVLSPKFKSSIIHPNEHGDWVSMRNDKFEDYIPLQPDKKFNKKSSSFFNSVAIGVATNRDSWVYNYSLGCCKKNCSSMIDFYNNLVDINESYEENYDSTKIAWTRKLKNKNQAKEKIIFEENEISPSLYRPFCKQYLYNEKNLIESPGVWNKLFPTIESGNIIICTSGLGAKNQIRPVISKSIIDLNCLEAGTQCFPLYWYEEKKDNEYYIEGDLFGNQGIEYIKHDGVTDFILARAKEKYGPKVTKEDIFYYVYGILHQKEYTTKFEADLKKMLPRLPLVADPQKFWAFSKAGRELAKLHIDYESIPAYEGVTVEGDRGNYLVDKMRFPSKGEKETIIYNNDITIKNIPLKAYDYVVNGKSAIDWIMERYQVTVNKNSQIKNDPNDWAIEHNQPRYILDLLLSVINVSVQTVDIVNSLPDVDWDKE